MGESTGSVEKVQKTEKTQKKSFFKGLQTEYRKIIWPDRERITKETAVALIGTVVIGAVIAVLDFIIKWGLSFII